MLLFHFCFFFSNKPIKNIFLLKFNKFLLALLFLLLYNFHKFLLQIRFKEGLINILEQGLYIFGNLFEFAFIFLMSKLETLIERSCSYNFILFWKRCLFSIYYSMSIEFFFLFCQIY